MHVLTKSLCARGRGKNYEYLLQIVFDESVFMKTDLTQNFDDYTLNTVKFLGPLKNRQSLIGWLSSIHFEGDIMKMLADSDLMYPRQWLGGGKSNG